MLLEKQKHPPTIQVRVNDYNLWLPAATGHSVLKKTAASKLLTKFQIKNKPIMLILCFTLNQILYKNDKQECYDGKWRQL